MTDYGIGTSRRLTSMDFNAVAPLMIFGGLVIDLVGATACSGTRQAPTRESVVSRSAAAQPPPSAPRPTNQSGFEKTFSVANSRQGSLEECVDLVVRVGPMVNGTAHSSDEVAARVQSRLMEFGTALKRPCAEQFATSLVLATCYAVTKREGQELELIQHYYNPTTVGLEDLYMRECLRLGGTWEALAKDSPEFRKARANATIRSLEALVAGSG